MYLGNFAKNLAFLHKNMISQNQRSADKDSQLAEHTFSPLSLADHSLFSTFNL